MFREAGGFAWVALAALLVTGTGAQGAEFKIATVAPEGSQWMQDMRLASAEIKKRTEGRVIVKLYGGGVQGNEKKVLRKIRIGQLQGGAFTALGISEVYPDMVIYGLPMLFDSLEEVDYVRQRMDPALQRGLEQAGFVSFGFTGGGFARILANRPIITTNDMRGQKVWLPDGDRVSYAALEALELSPVVLPVTDVLTGLQTGLLDVIAAPPVGVVALQWHTRVKYMTTVPLMYTMGLMAVDGKAFAGLGAPDQAVFRDVMTRMYQKFDAQSRADDDNAQKALRTNGIKFVDAGASDVQLWRQTVSQTNKRLGQEGVYTPALLEQLSGHLQEFRARSGTPAAGKP
jgi:TRAP-type C4-dicarboxylate transport system substrate-binding protein